MASINFPDPAAQTPINTFSPTSSPSATLNGLTYEWSNGSWSIIDNETVTAAPNLQKVTDIGNQTTADLITSGAITAETIDGNVVATAFDIEQGTANDKVITPATLAAALNDDSNPNTGINKVGYYNWRHSVRKGMAFDAVWEDDDTIVFAGFDTEGLASLTDIVAYKPRQDIVVPFKSPFPITNITPYNSSNDYRPTRAAAPKIDRNPTTNTYIVSLKTSVGYMSIYRCVDPINTDSGWTTVHTISSGGPSTTTNAVKYLGNNTWVTGYAYSSTTSDGVGLYSTDDGLTWTAVTATGDYYQPGGMTNISKTGNTLVGDIGACRDGSTSGALPNNYFISSDNGKTWSALDTNQTDSVLKRVFSAIISDEGTLFYSSAYKTGLTYRSTDSGITWNQTEIPTRNQYGYNFSKDSQGNLYAFQSQITFNNCRPTSTSDTDWVDEHTAMVFKSEDDGLTWEAIGKSVQWKDGPMKGTYANMFINPAGTLNVTTTTSYGTWDYNSGQVSNTSAPGTISNTQHALSTSSSAFSVKDAYILNACVPFFFPISK